MSYTAIGEMTDGTVQVGLSGGGLQRVASSSRVCVASLGRWLMYELDAVMEAVAAPSAAEVVALHRAGWAVAVSGTALELWQYSGGAWGLAAVGPAAPVGTWELIVRPDEVWAVQATFDRAWVRRGSALVEVAAAQWPRIVRDRASVGSGPAAWWRQQWMSIGESYDGLTSQRSAVVTPVENALVDRVFVNLAVDDQGDRLWLTGAAATVGAAVFGIQPPFPIYGSMGFGVYDGATWQMVMLTDPSFEGYLNFLTRGQNERVWAVRNPGVIYTIETRPLGLIIYAEEQDGVLGLRVEGASEESANGWYAPGEIVNGKASWVNENGLWWIIWDGTQWILAPYGETSGGYATMLDGTGLGLVVIGAPDETANGEYALGPDVNGRPSWEQVDGEHRVIWDGTQWVLVDGDGNVIYSNGDQEYPWMGLWTDGVIVAGRLVETDELLAPAGTEVRFLSETDAGRAAVEARVIVDAPAADLAQMSALIRVDSTAEARDWRSYRLVPIGAPVQLETAGTVVECAIVKPAAVDVPEGTRLETERFEE